MVTRVEDGVNADGTAAKAALEHYTVAGKTGTRKKPSTALRSRKYFSSFIGFFPADNPELCISITMDEPKGGHYGGQTAAPIFNQIAERAANYLNIRPEERRGPASGRSGAPGEDKHPQGNRTGAVMKTTTMKGNHELVHLAPPLRRGGGKRPQLHAKTARNEAALQQSGRHRQCDPARVVGAGKTSAGDGCPPPRTAPLPPEAERPNGASHDSNSSRAPARESWSPPRSDVTSRAFALIRGRCKPAICSLRCAANVLMGTTFSTRLIRKGARAIVVERDRVPADAEELRDHCRADTRKALGHAGTRYRAGFLAAVHCGRRFQRQNHHEGTDRLGAEPKAAQHSPAKAASITTSACR